MQSATAKRALAVFFICFGVYSLTNYGGVRAPDSEVVFRVAESLADGRGFSPRDLESWPGFGVSRGTGGRLYSVYPPMESLVLVPGIRLGQLINQFEWYAGRRLPYSHYVGNGLNKVMFGAPERDLRPHALRYIVSWFDVLVSALAVAAFYAVLLRLTGSASASLIVALFYAFGTLAWPYAGSFFSEPLALLLVLMSFYGLLVSAPISGGDSRALRPLWPALSGIALGLATATHPTALLFLPFFAAYLVYARLRPAGLRSAHARPAWYPVIAWLAGLGIILVLLGVYNHARFGSFLESGRGLSAANRVEFVSPFSAAYWRSLFNVLFATGKGLLLFCPAVVLGAVAWRRFHRESPALSVMLAAAIVVRLLFNASYKDWHAGFSLGPRYLLLIVPFFLIPLGFWLKDAIRRRSWKATAGAAALMYLCVVQQIYFALGEIFSYYHLQSFYNIRRGIETVQSQRIYLDWSLSPLGHLHQFNRGPFLLQSLGVSNLALWLIASAVFLGIIVAAGLVVRKRLAGGASPVAPD